MDLKKIRKAAKGPGVARGQHHKGPPALLASRSNEAAMHFLGVTWRRSGHPELPGVHEAKRPSLAAARKGAAMSEYGYNVLAEYSGEVSEGKAEHITDVLLEKLPSAAIGIDGTGLNLRFSLVTEDEYTLGQMSDEAERIADSALHDAGLENMRLQRLQVQNDAALEREITTPNMPELVGLTEIAWILGVSKQRVGQLRERDDFPKPVAELRSGPVWARPMLDRFIDDWPRRSGRPPRQDIERIAKQLIREVGYEFNERERAIVQILATGASGKEGAARLGMNPEAFRSATRRILVKLQTYSRLEALDVASRSDASDEAEESVPSM